MKDSVIRSFLVACDFSADANHAANRAALLAREHKADLRLLTVVRESLLGELRKYLGAQSDATQRILDSTKLDVDALAARLKDTAEVSERIVRAGDVEAEILATADHSDVLVLGAHGLNPTRDLLLGTTAERLLRKSRRPMIVVKKEPRAAYQRAFVAVDFSMHSMAALEFAVRIAPCAQLHVFHAFECPYESNLRRADIPEEILRDLQSQCRDQAFSNVRNMMEKSEVPAERVTSVVVPGNPRHVTHSAAADWGADLIVLGKHGHSAIDEFFLGGVTRHTLSRAQCDVAVIPDYPRL